MELSRPVSQGVRNGKSFRVGRWGGGWRRVRILEDSVLHGSGEWDLHAQVGSQAEKRNAYWHLLEWPQSLKESFQAGHFWGVINSDLSAPLVLHSLSSPLAVIAMSRAVREFKIWVGQTWLAQSFCNYGALGKFVYLSKPRFLKL